MMALIYRFPGHKLDRHEDCERPSCYICEGGLACCVTCGGAENSLPSHCPQRRMTCVEIESVSDGDTDYDSRLGWHKVHGKIGPQPDCRCARCEPIEGVD